MRNSGLLQSWCRKCKRDSVPFDERRDYELKRKHGISLDDYNKMFVEQNGCCFICNKHQSELKKALAVDHCHKTLRIRKLLCGNCNVGLGNFQDDKDLLMKATEYLS